MSGPCRVVAPKRLGSTSHLRCLARGKGFSSGGLHNFRQKAVYTSRICCALRRRPYLCGCCIYFFFFFPRAFFPRLGLSELFYWAASRHWDCFYTGQSPDVQSPKAKSTGKSGGVGGEATGVCGVRGELCKEVTEGGGFAFEIVMGGWVFENEGGGKCC